MRTRRPPISAALRKHGWNRYDGIKSQYSRPRTQGGAQDMLVVGTDTRADGRVQCDRARADAGPLLRGAGARYSHRLAVRRRCSRDKSIADRMFP